MPPEQPLATGYAAKAAALGEEDDYVPGPKLDKDWLLETAEGLRADHSVRIAQAKTYSHFLDGSNPGTFEEDADLIEDGIMETMPLLGAREEHEFRVGWLASHDPYPRMLNRDLIDGDEAIVVEDTVLYDLQCEARQYARRHAGTDINLARATHLLRFGAIVGIDILDPEDTQSGLEMDLLDPLTFFPVWGGPHGLLEGYRVYEDTNEAIIGTFGGKPGTREYRRIEDKVKRTATKTKRGKRNVMTRGELRTVTQAWTYDEMVVVLDEEVELLRVQHGYRRVPITVTLGAFDQPVGVAIGTEWDEMEPRQYPTNWGQVTVSGASMDLARQWRPFNWRQMWAHQIAEAVAGRQLSFLKWAADPFMQYRFDPSTDAANKLAEKPQLLPGEWVRVPLPNELSIVSPVMDPTAAAGVAANLQANASGGGFLTQMRLGAVPPQTSGSAMTKLQMAGGASDITLVRALQSSIRARAEWRLELRRVFGDAIGDPLGVVRVPARQGYASPIHALTPDLLDRAGTEVDIELFQFTPDVAAAQWATTMRTPSPATGKPLASDGTLRRRLKIAPDIEREEARIEREILNAQPPVAQQLQIAALQRDLEEAQDAGDDETAADLMIQIAELTYLHDLSVMKGEAAPPNGSAPGGQQTPPALAQPPQTPALPGTSLPEQGIAVGDQGGRPFGASGPPQPVTQPTPLGGGTP
jgi:hypothetical protein